jgi:hypothetical protein
MKHILNNLTEQEKNAIREQHAGGMKVITENFYRLLNSNLGDVRPLSEQAQPSQYRVGQVLKAKRDVDGQMYTITIRRLLPGGSEVVADIVGPGEYEGHPLDADTGRSKSLNISQPGMIGGNQEMGMFTIVK